MSTGQWLQDIYPPWSGPEFLVYPKFQETNIKEMDYKEESGIWGDVWTYCVVKQQGLPRPVLSPLQPVLPQSPSWHLGIHIKTWPGVIQPLRALLRARMSGLLPEPTAKSRRAGSQVHYNLAKKAAWVWSSFQLDPTTCQIRCWVLLCILFNSHNNKVFSCGSALPRLHV